MAEIINTADDEDEDFWEDEEDYSEEERKRMEVLYDSTLRTFEENQIVHGKIVSIGEKETILNIGFKSEGIVPNSEFRDTPDLKPGDEIEVFIENVEDAHGQLLLSRKRAKSLRSWERILKSMEEDLVLEGFVDRRTKGGFVVDIEGAIEAFLPGSQIDVKPVRDFDAYVGRTMEFKVVKVNHAYENVVVSHKVLIEEKLEEQRKEILSNLEKGQVLEGTVKNMTNFGVFIDLGGVDGLLHITDISWGRINHPEEVLELDEKVNIVVLDFDDEKKRISLGMKQLTPHPWESLPENIVEGTKVKGRVVTVADYGVFLEIIPGVEGLIHTSEMSWSQHSKNPNDSFEVGQELEAIVLNVDREDRKMSLGLKQLTTDPWSLVPVKYPVESRHKGIVRNMTNYGLFVELEEGVDGLVHISDLSWTKKFNTPKDYVNVGDDLEVIVLSIDL
ncbi:MAG: 30S ribosomal protein S1, partial [Bacteroidota bacterium]